MTRQHLSRGLTVRFWLSGALGVPVLGNGALLATLPLWPRWPGIGTLAAILDSLVPYLAVLGLIGCLGLALLRVVWPVTVLALLLTLFGSGWVALRHLQQSLPLQPPPADMTPVPVLWWNMLFENPRPPEDLVAALAASEAEVIVLGEAAPLRGQAALLAPHFPIRAGCENPARRCDLMVLARDPATRVLIHALGRAQEHRLAVVQVMRPDAPPMTLVAAHLVKPWFFGFAEGDHWGLRHVLMGIDGPVVLMGDFNAAPWAHDMQALITGCAMAPVRRAHGTWPASAGALGVPIDQVMVRGGARLSGVEPWGDGLGSNHRGLLIGAFVPPDAERPPVPETCVPAWARTPPGRPAP